MSYHLDQNAMDCIDTCIKCAASADTPVRDEKAVWRA